MCLPHSPFDFSGVPSAAAVPWGDASCMLCGCTCEVSGVGEVEVFRLSREFSSSLCDSRLDRGLEGGSEEALFLLWTLLADLPYSSLKRGRRVGRHAQIIPTDCSMEDQVDGITLT